MAERPFFYFSNLYFTVFGKNCTEKLPNMAEVLREEAQKAERLRILLMALDCKNLEELIEKLKAEEHK